MFTGTVVGRLVFPVKYGVYSGTQITSMRIASKRGRKDKEGNDTDFIDVKVFGKLGESIVGWGLEKGSILSISGDVQINSYTKNNGEKRQDVTLVASKVEVIKWVTAENAEPQPAAPAPHLEQVQDEPDLPF